MNEQNRMSVQETLTPTTNREWENCLVAWKSRLEQVHHDLNTSKPVQFSRHAILDIMRDIENEIRTLKCEQTKMRKLET